MITAVAELSVCGVSSPEIQKMTCVPQSTFLSSMPKRDSEVFEDIDVSNGEFCMY